MGLGRRNLELVLKTSEEDPSICTINTPPSDAAELLYVATKINKSDAWTLVDCAATWLFVSKSFVEKNNLPIEYKEGNILDGRGKVMAPREGVANITVECVEKKVECAAEVMEMPEGRDLVIGLPFFPHFGFSVDGLPALDSNLSLIHI